MNINELFEIDQQQDYRKKIDKGIKLKPTEWWNDEDLDLQRTIDRLKADLNNEKTVTVTSDGRVVKEGSEQGTELKGSRWYSPWYNENKKRFVYEKDIMNKKHNLFELKKKEDDQIYWRGALRTIRGNYYAIDIVYPDDFPYSPHKVYIKSPKNIETKHMWSDGSLCLFKPSDRSWINTTTASTMVTWAATWLFCYEEYKITGQWPGKEADQ